MSMEQNIDIFLKAEVNVHTLVIRFFSLTGGIGKMFKLLDSFLS